MSKDKELIVRSRNKRPREGVYHEGWIVLNAPAPETLGSKVRKIGCWCSFW